MYGVESDESEIFVINVTTFSYTIVSMGSILSIKKSVESTLLSSKT